MNKDNGGPAFPVADPFRHNPANEIDMQRLSGGMSLRDYFAAKALSGMLSNPELCGAPEDAATAAYAMADALLQERLK